MASSLKRFCVDEQCLLKRLRPSWSPGDVALQPKGLQPTGLAQSVEREEERPRKRRQLERLHQDQVQDHQPLECGRPTDNGYPGARAPSEGGVKVSGAA